MDDEVPTFLIPVPKARVRGITSDYRGAGVSKYLHIEDPTGGLVRITVDDRTYQEVQAWIDSGAP